MLSVGLTGSSTCWNESFGFLEGAHNRRLPSSPTICTTSPSLHEDWPLVWLVVVHFACPTISSIPHYCTVSTSRCLSQFVLKTEHFHYISVKNRVWKYGEDTGSTPGSGRSPGEGNGHSLQYSCLENSDRGAWRATIHGVSKSWTWLSDWAHTHTDMWDPNITVINIPKLVQMIFNAWFWYFEYIGYLLYGIILIVLNVLIWLLSTSAGLPKLVCHPARNLQHQTLQTTFDTFD